MSLILNTQALSYVREGHWIVRWQIFFSSRFFFFFTLIFLSLRCVFRFSPTFGCLWRVSHSRLICDVVVTTTHIWRSCALSWLLFYNHDCLDKLDTSFVYTTTFDSPILTFRLYLVQKKASTTLSNDQLKCSISLQIRSGLASDGTLADFATNDTSLALAALTDFTTGSLTQLSIFIHIYTFSASAAQRENCISSYLTFACEFIIDNSKIRRKNCARLKILLFWPGLATDYQSKVSEQVRQVRRRQQKREAGNFFFSFSDSLSG